jgi:3-deoxy-D-manno-octulosonic-acid transferase
VIRELKRLYPTVPLIVTYSSPSAKKILESIHELDAWAALPWDFDASLSGFLSKWNPRALLFSRTDVWPNLARFARDHEVPSILFSATFADNSSRLKGLTKYLTKYSLNQLSAIHCVSDEDKKNLLKIKIKPAVTVSGDTRFDQVFHRLENPKPLKNSFLPQPEDFVFIAGSTWPEDEAFIVPALKNAKDKSFKIIFAPHEVGEEHLQQLEKNLYDAGLTSIRYSKGDNWGAHRVLIIDQIGILAELYTWADVAFIGGSFKKQVHSVMEALAAGLPVWVGPYHLNNREALYYQKKTFSSGMIVQVTHTANDITVLLERMQKHFEAFPHIKEEIRAEVGKNRNSTAKVISAIESLALANR